MNNRIPVVKGRTAKLEATLSCELDIDFDTAEVIFSLKERISDPDNEAICRLTIGAGVTLDTEEDGRYIIHVPIENVMETLEPDRVYYWDLVLKVGDDVYELDSGFFEVRSPVTKAA